MLKIQGALDAADQQPFAPPAFERNATARIASPAIATSTWITPLVLGTGFVIAALLLTFVELAQPPRQAGFAGIRYSNTVGSDGARQIVKLFRTHLDWLPRPFAEAPLSPSGYIWGLRIAWFAMLAMQIAAVWTCRRARATSPWPWAIGPAFASLVLMIYPPSSTDIYAYASFGWVAEHGENPYLRAPNSLHGDPFSRFNDWTHIRTPYGPIWSGISRAIVHLANDQPFATAIGFKLVATLSAFGLAAVVYLLAKRVTERVDLAVLAFVLVLWSPILITESTATVHLDPFMMLLALLGLASATGSGWRSPRLGMALVVSSALVKPVTLPLVALLLVSRFAEPDKLRTITKRIGWDMVAALGVVIVAFIPFWDTALPPAMLDNFLELYVYSALDANPLWNWGLAHFGAATHLHAMAFGDAGQWTIAIVGALLTITAGLFARSLREQHQTSARLSDRANARTAFRTLLYAWTAVAVAISALPVNAHPWYAIWPMGLLALLWISDGKRNRARPPVWLLALQAWTFLSFIIYHTLPKI